MSESCVSCECPVETTIEQRMAEGMRDCRCTPAELREELARAYKSISEHGAEVDSLKVSLTRENYRIVDLEEKLGVADHTLDALRRIILVGKERP